MAPRKGRWTWLYDVKSVISASRPPRIRVIQPWMSNSKPYPRRTLAAQSVIHLYYQEALLGLNRQSHHTRGLKAALASRASLPYRQARFTTDRRESA